MSVRKITLYGLLARKYGKEHELDASTVLMCFSGLQSRFASLRQDLLLGKQWQVLVNNKPLHKLGLNKQLSEDELDIKIVPVIAGAIAEWVVYAFMAIIAVLAVYMYTQMPDTDGSGNASSYMFNGSVNSKEQGGPVPLVYGRTRVGSIVISSGVYAEEYKDASYGGGGGFTGPGTGVRYKQK